MSDSEPTGIQVEDSKTLLNDFEAAEDDVWGFMSNIGIEDLRSTNIGRLEKSLNTVANGLEDSRKFHEAATVLWKMAQEAPESWEDNNDITIPNRIGLYALKAISDHSEALKKRVHLNNNSSYWGYMLTAQALGKKVWLIDSTIKDKAIDILKSEKEAVKRAIFKGNGTSGALAKYYQIYLPDEFNSWLRKLDLMMDKKPTEVLIKTVGILSSKDTFYETRKVVENIIRGKKFNISKTKSAALMESWLASEKYDDIGQAIENNLSAMYTLENQEPGSVKYLNETFGINCFGRYPVEMLVEQYRTRNDKDSPYGLMIFPRGDWNGSFYEQRSVFSDFFGQLQNIKGTDRKKYGVKIFECRNLFSVGRSVITSYRNYGRIHFAVVCGHGSRTGIWFDNHEYLSKDDILNGKGIQRITDFFVPRPPVVIVACSAGQKEGIAEEISRVGGGEVFGSQIDTHIKSLSVRLDNSALKFDVQYSKGATAAYNK